MSAVFGRCPDCGESVHFYHDEEDGSNIVVLVMDIRKHLKTCELKRKFEDFYECFMCGCPTSHVVYLRELDDHVCKSCSYRMDL